MKKLKDYNDLLWKYNEYKGLLEVREGKNKNSGEKHILICGGTGCKSSDSINIKEKLEEEIIKLSLQEKVKVKITGCFGFCAEGPMVRIHPEDILYVKVKADDVEEIIKSHIVEGKVVERLVYVFPGDEQKIYHMGDIPFYKKQIKVALKKCDFIDCEDIYEVIGSGGYLALGKVLTEMTSQEVINEVSDSGLRGRGGGGFPTGIKWAATAKSEDLKKYVICNADEGDPGAFMDRSILEGDPASVLEAMAICGYAIGSDKGYIYIRAEYLSAVGKLKLAIRQAEELGLLGENILGTGFNFSIDIKYGAGAFVCGEATALIHSIEGNRGEPTIKPPRTSYKGLWNKPTCVNNVETFANIPEIINKGSRWYKSMGTEKSAGTKVFALAGKINNVGLVEVPMGMTLREVIYEIGGGLRNNKKLKAVQTGGPSGGCIPDELLDIAIEYDTLIKAGSMMGSGGMIVMDEDDCMVDIAKFYLDFIVDESCGKCTPCRIGNKRVLELLTRITEGNGTEEDLIKIKELCQVIKDTSLCGLGESAPNPVMSTINFFLDEYYSHIKEKKCQAKVCKKLISYNITEKCIGCTKCTKVCVASCIDGKLKEKHKIDSVKCVKCGMCYKTCPVKAIVIQ